MRVEICNQLLDFHIEQKIFMFQSSKELKKSHEIQDPLRLMPLVVLDVVDAGLHHLCCLLFSYSL